MNKRLLFTATIVLVGVLVRLPATSQSTVDKAAPISQPTQYVLGPGDLISLHVQDLEDVSEKPVRIDPSGSIDLPLIGRITAGGLSVEELRESLTKKLVKFIEAPQVAINVVEYHSQPISVLGAVNSPGVQQLQSPKRLLDVISVAGGLKPEAGSRLTITRQIRWGVLPLPHAHTDESGQFSIAEVPLDTLTKSVRPTDNIFLLPNDTVAVPKAEIIYVLGQVKRSGGFPLDTRDSISIIKALALAQGFERDAAPRKARIVRASELASNNAKEIPVNIQQILDGKAPDVQLSADDVLYVPSNAAKSATRRAAEAALQIATGVVIYR